MSLNKEVLPLGITHHKNLIPTEDQIILNNFPSQMRGIQGQGMVTTMVVTTIAMIAITLEDTTMIQVTLHVMTGTVITKTTIEIIQDIDQGIDFLLCMY